MQAQSNSGALIHPHMGTHLRWHMGTSRHRQKDNYEEHTHIPGHTQLGTIKPIDILYIVKLDM